MTTTPPKITIRPGTVKEEFGYLKSVLSRLQFYKDNRYTVGLPDNKQLLDPQIQKDSVKMFSIFETSEYDKGYFAEGLKILNAHKDFIESLVQKLLYLKDLWDFKVFSKYTVVLTKYGPGGSYNPDTGKIDLFATKEGKFKGGDPVETIVHEIIHIGIEESIVKKFRLTHWEKERLVDLLVKTLFAKELPGHKLQGEAKNKIDGYINLESIKVLPETVASYAFKH